MDLSSNLLPFALWVAYWVQQTHPGTRWDSGQVFVFIGMSLKIPTLFLDSGSFCISRSTVSHKNNKFRPKSGFIFYRESQFGSDFFFFLNDYYFFLISERHKCYLPANFLCCDIGISLPHTDEEVFVFWFVFTFLFLKCLNNPNNNMLIKHIHYDDLNSSGALKEKFWLFGG